MSQFGVRNLSHTLGVICAFSFASNLFPDALNLKWTDCLLFGCRFLFFLIFQINGLLLEFVFGTSPLPHPRILSPISRDASC